MLTWIQKLIKERVVLHVSFRSGEACYDAANCHIPVYFTFLYMGDSTIWHLAWIPRLLKLRKPLGIGVNGRFWLAEWCRRDRTFRRHARIASSNHSVLRRVAGFVLGCLHLCLPAQFLSCCSSLSSLPPPKSFYSHVISTTSSSFHLSVFDGSSYSRNVQTLRFYNNKLRFHWFYTLRICWKKSLRFHIGFLRFHNTAIDGELTPAFINAEQVNLPPSSQPLLYTVSL